MTRFDLATAAGSLRYTIRFFTTTAILLVLLGFWAAYGSAILFMLAMMSVLWIPVYLIVFVAHWWTEGIAPTQAPVKPLNRVLLGLAPPALLVWMLMVTLPLLWAGVYLGDLTRLAINHRSYAQIVAQAQMAGEEEWFAESAEGITYSVDPGPPVRVAFNPEGMLVNWGAIVFDPTGAMTQADGFDPVTGEFRAPAHITRLFGGDLVSCRRLWGDYYRCGWT